MLGEKIPTLSWSGFGGLRFKIWEFPKIRGTFLVVPHTEDYNILGPILGYPNFGKLPFRL